MSGTADLDGYTATEAHYTFSREVYESAFLAGLLNEAGFPLDGEPEGLLAQVLSKVADRNAVERARARLVEIVFQHVVDLYLMYLTQLLGEIYRSRPEMLLSKIDGQQSPSVDLREALQHETIESLVDSLVEKRVLALSYKGLPELAVHLQRQLGFVLYENEADLELAVLIVEMRNLLTHNRGIVNERFMERAKGPEQRLGDRIRIAPEQLPQLVEFMERSAASIDDRALAKWKLPAIYMRRVDDGPAERIGVWDAEAEKILDDDPEVD